MKKMCTRVEYYNNIRLKYNNNDEVLVGGCINMDGDYRQFFIDCMSKVKVYKYIDIAELSQ